MSSSEGATRPDDRKRSRWIGSVGALMGTIACIGIGLAVYQLSKRWTDDWAFDRREAASHRHEAAFYAGVRNDMEADLSRHPGPERRIRIIHGLVYWRSPDLERYVDAMAAYHEREAKRHEWAVGRRWAYVSPAQAPKPPPRVPADEIEPLYRQQFGPKG